jgi:transposase
VDAIRAIAETLDCSVEALRRWVRERERDGGQRRGLTTDEPERFKELERENRELKWANEIYDAVTTTPATECMTAT